MEKDCAGTETAEQLHSAKQQNNPSKQPELAKELSNSGDTSSTELTRQSIEESLTQIMADINTKRKEDINIVTTIKKEIMAQAALSCKMIEDQMRAMHDSKGKELDEVIKKLVNSLEKIRSMENDLEESKLSLQTLFQEMQKAMAKSLD